MRISDWSSDVCSSDLVRESPRKLLPRSVATFLPFQSDYSGASGCRSGRAASNAGSARQAFSMATMVGYGVRSTPNRRALYRSEEHTSELQSLMRNSYAVFCLKKKKKNIDKQVYE